MPQINIDGKSYDVYADVAQADEYLGGSISEAATAWRAADADTKGRGLVSATRWLDSMTWKEGYATFAQRVAVEAIVNACILLAAGLVADPDLRTTISQTAAKRLKAGSVEIEYFRGSSVEISTPFPAEIMALLRPYLEGAGAAGRFGGVMSSGTCRPDAFTNEYDYSRGI
jgi:hypothetical protein